MTTIVDSNDPCHSLAYPCDRDYDRDLSDRIDRICRVCHVCPLCSRRLGRNICPVDPGYHRSLGGVETIDLDHGLGPGRDRADLCPCCRCACCHSDRESCSDGYGVFRSVLQVGFSSSPLRWDSVLRGFSL